MYMIYIKRDVYRWQEPLPSVSQPLCGYQDSCGTCFFLSPHGTWALNPAGHAWQEPLPAEPACRPWDLFTHVLNPFVLILQAPVWGCRKGIESRVRTEWVSKVSTLHAVPVLNKPRTWHWDLTHWQSACLACVRPWAQVLVLKKKKKIKKKTMGLGKWLTCSSACCVSLRTCVWMPRTHMKTC